TEHHDRAAKIGAGIPQFNQILSRGLADRSIACCEVQSFSLREQPMQPTNLKAVCLGGLPQFLPLFETHISDSRCQRERRQFNPGIACLRHELALPLPVPVFKQFLADREFHGSLESMNAFQKWPSRKC